MAPQRASLEELACLIPRDGGDAAGPPRGAGAPRAGGPRRAAAALVVIGVGAAAARAGWISSAAGPDRLSAKDFLTAVGYSSADVTQDLFAATAGHALANGTRLRWMWGDASILGHWLAERDPLRWSACKSVTATADELQAFAGSRRPVELQACGRGRGSATRMFADVHAAIRGLGGSLSPPFDFDPEVSERLALMSRAAYCADRADLLAWTCESCKMSGLTVEPGSVRNFSGRAVASNYGFTAKLLAPAPFANACLLALRGSHSPNDLLVDVNEVQTAVPQDWGCSSCYVHAGFLSAWLDLEKNVADALRASSCESQGTGLFLTGHSLGAALATLGAWSLRHRHGFNVSTIYTYESPRVGTTEFVSAWDADLSQSIPSFRVTSEDDPVQFVPCFFGRYMHVQYQVHYRRSGAYEVIGQRESPCKEPTTIIKAAIQARWGEHCHAPYLPSNNLCWCTG